MQNKPLKIDQKIAIFLKNAKNHVIFRRDRFLIIDTLEPSMSIRTKSETTKRGVI